MRVLIWIGLAGALGALARYGTNWLAQLYLPKSFPWGTLIANALGCFVFGWFWTFSDKRMLLAPELRLIVFVGFLGAFTTFSTFAFQSMQLAATEKWLLATLNILANNAIGILFVCLGVALGSR